jgi:hypothetical protein
VLATNEASALKFSNHGAKVVLRSICAIDGMEFLDARNEARGALLKLLPYSSNLDMFVNTKREVRLFERYNRSYDVAFLMRSKSKQFVEDSMTDSVSASCRTEGTLNSLAPAITPRPKDGCCTIQ